MYKNYYICKENNNLETREKALEYGIEFMNNQELLILLLGSGIKNCPVDILAKNVLAEIDKNSSESLLLNLQSLKGVGLSKATQICASIELGKRLFNTKNKVIKKAADILPLVQHYALEPVEYFIAISLNAAREVIKIHEISKGSGNCAIIQPREVFSELLLEHARGVIFVHNHPSGLVKPSDMDIQLTSRMISGGKLLGIQTLDHIIVAINEFFSFAENNLLEE